MLLCENFSFGRSKIESVLPQNPEVPGLETGSSGFALFHLLRRPYRRLCRRRRHASAVAANFALRARHLYPSRAREVSPPFYPFLLPRAHAEPDASRARRRRPSGRSSPLRSISSRPKPSNLALHLLHPSTSSIKSFPDRIALAIAGRH